VHPSARIVLYLFSALVIPGLSFFGLGCVFGAVIVGTGKRLAPVSRLLWRTRWLFLLIFAGYAYNQPGEALLPILGDWSPTREGIWSGMTSCLRLLIVLLLLDLLVLSLPREPQLAGLYGLLRPAAGLGIDAERTTIRLGLTLAAMERPIAERRSLRTLFLDDNALEQEQTFLLTRFVWQTRDVALLGAGIVTLAWLWRYA
jgi:hypothetical protein